MSLSWKHLDGLLYLHALKIVSIRIRAMFTETNTDARLDSSVLHEHICARFRSRIHTAVTFSTHHIRHT